MSSSEMSPSESGATAEPVQSSPAQGVDGETSRTRLLGVMLLIVALWTYAYNIAIKNQGPVRAFFQILDTISDDFVMGALLTILAGVGILIVFSVTKLYSQVIARIDSFRVLETLLARDLRPGRLRELGRSLMAFRELPEEPCAFPRRVSGLLMAFAFIYGMSWMYVVLFSEALFFVSWSAGVDLPINYDNMLFMPTLALAIPFSARVMAYIRYPYAQDYADFMPGAVFVYLLVTALGFLFQSQTQVFFLARVFADPELVSAYLTNGIFLAFVPVFFEAGCWAWQMNRLPAGTETVSETETDSDAA